MEVCRSLSRFTTGAFLSLDYLELFLWGIPDLDDKIVHGIGGFTLIHQFGFGIVQMCIRDRARTVDTIVIWLIYSWITS